jgi:eukaryotic-like serine/threonine-protein kinase
MAVLANRYELGDALGAGGMARVVSAYDNVLHRDVAIKLIHDSSAGDPTSRERMLREARAAAGLHHPNTVAVFDAGEADGRPFIVMERVVGWSLGDRLQDEGPLSVADTLAIADAVLAALQAAHARGLVHRDVKPSNILLPDSGGVKLADFGIAKALAETSAGLTSTGQLLGTPRYLAPEQVAGRPASPASDLYSLAVVLYQCLTGEPPFMAETPLAEALAHQREPVPEVAKAAPHVPAAVARTVERALAKEPSERFADAAAMRRALHDPAATLPPPPPAAPTSATTALLESQTDPAANDVATRAMGAAQPGVAQTAVTEALAEPTAATEALAQPTADTQALTAETAVAAPAGVAQTSVMDSSDSAGEDTESASSDADPPGGGGSKRRWLIIAAVAAVVVVLVAVLVIANRGGDTEDTPRDTPPADDGGEEPADNGDTEPREDDGQNENNQPGGGEQRDPGNGDSGNGNDEQRDSDNGRSGNGNDEQRDPDDEPSGDEGDSDEEQPGNDDDQTGDEGDGDTEEEQNEPEPEPDPDPEPDDPGEPDEGDSNGSVDNPPDDLPDDPDA